MQKEADALVRVRERETDTHVELLPNATSASNKFETKKKYRIQPTICMYAKLVLEGGGEEEAETFFLFFLQLLCKKNGGHVECIIIIASHRTMRLHFATSQ